MIHELSEGVTTGAHRAPKTARFTILPITTPVTTAAVFVSIHTNFLALSLAEALHLKDTLLFEELAPPADRARLSADDSLTPERLQSIAD